MIEIISIAFALLGLLMTWSLAKAAGDADKRIEEFYQTFLLGEESQDGSGSKKFSRRHKHKLSVEEKLERDLKDCIAESERDAKMLEQDNTAKEMKLEEFLNMEKFDTEKLREIIKVIRVHSQEEIEIEWNFDDVFLGQR